MPTANGSASPLFAADLEPISDLEEPMLGLGALLAATAAEPGEAKDHPGLPFARVAAHASARMPYIEEEGEPDTVLSTASYKYTYSYGSHDDQSLVDI